MKKLNLLTMGSASLFVAGVAMAAPPVGFSYGQYTVTAGNPTANACPAGYTCVGLAATGVGILQQQVNETATGKSYIRTIIVEDTADTAGNNAIVGATYNLDFTNESFVGVTGNTAGDLGVDAGIKLLAQGGNQGVAVPNTVDASGGNNQMVASISQGNLVGPGDPTNIKIIQRQKLDSGGATGTSGQGQTDFVLLSNGSEADRYMRLDQRVTSDAVEAVTVRRSSGSYTTGSGSLTLPNDPVGLAYNAGDDIGVVYLQYRQFGGAGLTSDITGSPTADPRRLQMQSYTVNGTTITWNSCNSDGKGRCEGIVTGGAWTYWDPNFGTAPNSLAAAAQAAIPLPNFPD